MSPERWKDTLISWLHSTAATITFWHVRTTILTESYSNSGLNRSYGGFGWRFWFDLAFFRAGRFCSDYFNRSGIGTPIRSKASRWALVGSVSIGTVALAPANRTWLRVMVARCSSRPRKLR